MIESLLFLVVIRIFKNSEANKILRKTPRFVGISHIQYLDSDREIPRQSSVIDVWRPISRGSYLISYLTSIEFPIGLSFMLFLSVLYMDFIPWISFELSLLTFPSRFFLWLLFHSFFQLFLRLYVCLLFVFSWTIVFDFISKIFEFLSFFWVFSYISFEFWLYDLFDSYTDFNVIFLVTNEYNKKII